MNDKPDKPWVKEHSLSLAISALLVLLLMVGYALPTSQEEHAQNSFGLAHDTFGALVIVVLSKRLYERDSAAAKDPEDDE